MPPKKSTVDMTKNAIGDIVLGQLKGFPKWPCKVSSSPHRLSSPLPPSPSAPYSFIVVVFIPLIQSELRYMLML